MLAEDFVFRRMTLDDLPDIMSIEQDSFTTPWTEEAFINELTNNMFAQYMVMEYQGKVIGYGGMWIIVDEAHITNIAILTPYRGQGLGKRLMHELQKTARFLGAVRMTLEVRASNEIAQRLYRRYGFEAAGIRPGYYSDNQEDAVIMWADLPKGRTGTSDE